MPADVATSAALAQAEEHAGRGEHVEAIRLLSDANRRAPSRAIETRIVQLRHAAASSVSAGAPATWPQPFPDPYPDLRDQPPEVTPGELDLAVLGGSLQHHGCLVVRGILPPDAAVTIGEGVDRTFASRERQLEQGPDPDDPWYVPFDPGPEQARALEARRQWVREGGAVWAADTPRVMFQVLEELARIGLLDVIAGYLGERPLLSVNKSTLRRVEPGTMPAWHQDGAFLGDAPRAVNVWIALDECGGDADAPGLDLLPRRLDTILETGTEGAWINNEVGPQLVERVAGDTPILRPRFAPGDALLFDALFLHRTAPSEGLTRARRAIECWCFGSVGFPPDYLPLAL